MISDGGRTAELTIDQLAAQTGLSVRNIRAYQSRRLLPPPRIRGRVGYYGAEHVARIELVQRFRSDGFNLGAISALVERGDAFVAGVQQVRQELRDDPLAGWIPMSQEEQRLCEEYRPGSIARFLVMGTIRSGPDGVLLTDPRLSEAGWALNLLGFAPDTIIELLYETHGTIRKVGDVYVDVLWERSAAAMGAATSPEDVQAMRDVFAQLTPHAVQILTTLFEIVLRKEAAESFERTIKRLAPSS